MRRPARRGDCLRRGGFAALAALCVLALPAAAADRPARAKVGTASWYGDHHGQRTASGERFDRGDLTAAHPTLPMNSRVKVTNLANGRSVVLRINDRGPHTRGRLIDVSQAAAEMLGMKHRGVATVRVETVSD